MRVLLEDSGAGGAGGVQDVGEGGGAMHYVHIHDLAVTDGTEQYTKLTPPQC